MKTIEKVFRLAAMGQATSSKRDSNGLSYHSPACSHLYAAFGSLYHFHMIQAITQVKRNEIMKGFAEVFQPKGVGQEEYWFGVPWADSEEEHQQKVDHRTFALLFMAELAKDQGV